MSGAHYTRFDRWVAGMRHREAMRNIRPGARVCDVGCGVDALFLSELSSIAGTSIGLDHQPVTADLPNATFLHADVTLGFPLQDERFDHVTILALLEHLEKPEPVLGEAFRVLAPGGTLILTWPAAVIDPLLDVLMAIGVVARETEIDRHQPRRPVSHWRGVLQRLGFGEIHHRRFELGLNHLLVARKPGPDEARVAERPVDTMKLSVIVPIFNEQRTLEELLRRVGAVDIPKELILVDDGSTDGTPAILRAWEDDSSPGLQVVRHPWNLGKGAAVASGLRRATGDLVIIQDADMEYDPKDYAALMAPFDDPEVQVVYGSRNLRPNTRSSFSFYWGGRALSGLTNLLYGSHITDEATGYKLFRTELLRQIGVESRGFDFCPEVTAKVLRRGIGIREVPISYSPRPWREGKKISWRDGMRAAWVLLGYRLRRMEPPTDS